MPLSFPRQKALFKACDPATPLDPDDPRFVDVDALGGRGATGGRDWVSQLAASFSLADEPVRLLVSGLPGTGKSTELRRLARRLESDKNGGYLVCLIDAEELIDLRQPIEASDVLMSVVIGVEGALAAMGGDGARPDGGWFSRIWHELTDRDAELKEATASLGIGNVKIELKQSRDLRARVRRTLAKDHFHFRQQVTQACRSFLQQAVEQGNQGIVVLFDSLEKLRGDTGTFDSVLTSAERMFMSGAPDLALPIHALYSVPPALSLRIRNIDVLPMLKVRDRSGTEHPAGIAAARQLVAARIPEEDLDELIDPLGREELVQAAILESGGYPRDLVRILRLVVQAQHHPLSRRDFEDILTARAGEIREIASGQGSAGIRLLARVHARKRLEPEPPELPIADRFLAQNLILGYANAERWVDVHPAVLDLPGFTDAVAAERVAPPSAAVASV